MKLLQNIILCFMYVCNQTNVIFRLFMVLNVSIRMYLRFQLGKNARNLVTRISVTRFQNEIFSWSSNPSTKPLAGIFKLINRLLYSQCRTGFTNSVRMDIGGDADGI